ncbi:3-beta hydroxysteroid dehydrogenase/isomerase family protein [Bimuria novae-zelandiae CBS 107.79]|uniref:3-beta hydroxysteroid dehydrogenase/isomerase family protein n=1 Tax=Bimuria novae-zelandiae CBS 107.79 TaxID=1447943 RepID=A0A6A5V553_9PLEO|nr:3-beta hydroxysteroid dehydrogenase/isomerase family protein [Bimuria novae-zelandiae CBS 107.79]
MVGSDDRGLVAITGANGTIGYASTALVLQQGYSVRCVVRTGDAINTLQSGPSLQEFASRIEYAIVPDNTVAGAYDSALEGARYVIHVAGVWPTPADKHPDNDIYLPFVKSMENILAAAKKSGTVRRIVFTQAGAAMVHPDEGDRYGTAMDEALNESTPVQSGLLSITPPLISPHHAYCAAKAQCMVRLKELRASGTAPFSIVQIVPGTVMGPSELVSTKSRARKKMDRMARAILFNEPKPRYLFGFVHVEDCARVHVEALDEAKVAEKDLPDWFIAAASSDKAKNGDQVWKEAGDLIIRTFKEEVANGMFIVGRDNKPINMPYYADSTLTETLLLSGDRIRGLNECITEVAAWYKDLAE